jgi:DNA-binding winged helix-turn-helix (wHTH) protein
MIVLLHPDPAVAEALAQTLRPLLSGLLDTPPSIQCTMPKAVPPFQKNILYVSLGGIDQADTETAHLITHMITLEQSSAPLRIGALVRRLVQALNRVARPKQIIIQDALLDTDTRQWKTSQGLMVELTEKEVALLVYVAQSPHPVSRQDLLRDVWRYAIDTETHTVETHIHRLRQKIEKDPDHPTYLLTLKEGYQL